VAIDMKQWAARNERPIVAVYDTILGKRWPLFFFLHVL
jgi:hypothetical protein